MMTMMSLPNEDEYTLYSSHPSAHLCITQSNHKRSSRDQSSRPWSWLVPWLGSGSMKGNPLKESMVCDPIRGSRVSRYPIKGQSADFIVLEVTPAVTCGCACWHIDLATQWVRLHPACRMPREWRHPGCPRWVASDRREMKETVLMSRFVQLV